MLKNGMGDLLKQAQKMQEQLKEAQAKIAEAEVTGESGAGMVKVTMNGRHDVRKVQIDSALLTEEKEILEDLIAAAVNDAVRRVERHQKESMSGLGAQLGVPGGFNFTP